MANYPYGNPGVWGGPKKPKPKPKKPTSPWGSFDYDQMLAQANEAAAAQVKALIAGIQAEQDAARKQAELEWQREALGGQAYAYGLQQMNLGDKVQGIFQNAANAQSGLAQGFSGNLAAQAGADAAQQARMLSGTGQEGAVRNEGPAMANVTYGTGGFFPAQSLSTQGANFGAQAALEPGFALQFGQYAEAARRQAWLTELAKYQQAKIDAAGKKPGLAQDALKGIYDIKDSIYDNWIAGRAQNLNEDYYRNTARKTNAEITGFDENGMPIYDPSVAAANTKTQADKDKARAAAVTKRNDATAATLNDLGTFLSTAQGKPTVIGQQPVKVGSTTDPATGKSVPIYAKKGGGTTRHVDEAATQPIYSTVKGKISYADAYRQVMARLRRDLTRYGYKEAALQKMAVRLLDEAGIAKPPPPRTNPPHSDAGDSFNEDR